LFGRFVSLVPYHCPRYTLSCLRGTSLRAEAGQWPLHESGRLWWFCKSGILVWVRWGVSCLCLCRHHYPYDTCQNTVSGGAFKDYSLQSTKIHYKESKQSSRTCDRRNNKEFEDVGPFHLNGLLLRCTRPPEPQTTPKNPWQPPCHPASSKSWLGTYQATAWQFFPKEQLRTLLSALEKPHPSSIQCQDLLNVPLFSVVMAGENPAKMVV
jgi:hypothetical protein